jgi:hypothetical protein
MSAGKNLRVVDVAELDGVSVRLNEVACVCNAIVRLGRHPESDPDDDIRCLGDIAVTMLCDLSASIGSMGVPVSGEVTA